MASEAAQKDLDVVMEETTGQQPKSVPKKINLKLRSQQTQHKERQPKAPVEASDSSSSDDDCPPPPPPPRNKSPQKTSPLKSTPEKSGPEEDILTTYGIMDNDGLFEDWTNKVNLVGQKIADPLVFTCELCDQPILVYGRLLPCKHVFCYTCADKSLLNGNNKCVRKGCDSDVQKLERANAGSVFVCTFGTAKHDHKGCRRTYLSERDLQAHIDHRHIKAAKKTKSRSKVLKKENLAMPVDPRAKPQDYLHHKTPVVPTPDSISTSVPPPNVATTAAGQMHGQPPLVVGQFPPQPSRSANLITIPIQEERKMNPYGIPVGPPSNMALPPMSVPPPTMQSPMFTTAVSLTGTVMVQAPGRFQSPPPNVLPPGAIPPPNQRPPGPPPRLPGGPPHLQPPVMYQPPGQAQFPGQWIGGPGAVPGQQGQQVVLARPPHHMQPLPGQPHPGQQHPHPGQQPPHMSQTSVPLPNTSVPPPHIRPRPSGPPPFFR